MTFSRAAPWPCAYTAAKRQDGELGRISFWDVVIWLAFLGVTSDVRSGSGWIYVRFWPHIRLGWRGRAAGLVAFPGLKGPVPFDAGTFGYGAKVNDGAPYTPFLTSEAGNVMAGVYQHPGTGDPQAGVSELALNFDYNASQIQWLLLAPGLINWLTQDTGFWDTTSTGRTRAPAATGWLARWPRTRPPPRPPPTASPTTGRHDEGEGSTSRPNNVDAERPVV